MAIHGDFGSRTLQYGEGLGTIDERATATTSLLEIMCGVRRPPLRAKKSSTYRRVGDKLLFLILVRSPTFTREVHDEFPLLASDAKYNDNLHFTTVLITSHPSSPYYTHRFALRTKKRKGKAKVHKAHSSIVGGKVCFQVSPKRKKKCDNDGF
jgi:hypothetical protein